MRQMFIMNRTKRRQEKKYVEETGQPLLRFSKKNNCLLCQTIKIVWGKSRRQSQFSSSWGKFFFSILPLKKVASMSAMKKTTKATLFHSSSVWLEKKERGKVAKQEEKMASLLLTILDSSQGGSKNPQSLPLPCIMTSLWALSLKSNLVPCMHILGLILSEWVTMSPIELSWAANLNVATLRNVFSRRECPEVVGVSLKAPLHPYDTALRP